MIKLYLEDYGFKFSGKLPKFSSNNTNTHYFDYFIPFTDKDHKNEYFTHIDGLWLSSHIEDNIELKEIFVKNILKNKELFRKNDNGNHIKNLNGFISRMEPFILVNEEEMFYIELKYGELKNVTSEL